LVQESQLIAVLNTISEKVRFIESVFGRSRPNRNRTNIAVRCPRPECDSSKDPQKLKLVIRITDDANHCWVCGFRARSLLPLLLKHAGRDAIALYRERFYRGQLFDCPNHDAAAEITALPSDFRLLALAGPKDAPAQAALAYVRRRGLGERELWRFKLGVSDSETWRDRVIVPSFDRMGELNFFTGRALKRGMVSYRNCDADKTAIVFNELHVDWSARLVLCEGPFDLFKCGENAVPLLGSNLSEDSALMDALLFKRTPIAIAIDADMQEKALRFGRRLAEYGIDVVMVDLGNHHHDPGEMTSAEFRERLSCAKPWTWEGAILRRLARATKPSSATGPMRNAAS
jgi:hypothetical protein